MIDHPQEYQPVTIPRPRPRTDEELQAFLETQTADVVNHPAHYTDGSIEVADFICDKNLNFCLGNVVKYVARAGKKDPAKEIEDLQKASWYLNREIERLTSRETHSL